MILKMLNTLQIYLMCLLIVAFSSCTIADQAKYNINKLANESLSSVSTITRFGVVSAPNAPNRITRNIRQDREGNLLISAYKDIIQYDGKSLKP